MRLKFQVDHSPHLEASVCFRCTVVLQHIYVTSDAVRTSVKRSMIDFKSHSQTTRPKNTRAAA